MPEPSKLSSSAEEELFLEAISLPFEARREFIERRCRGNSGEAERLMDLLDGYVGNSAFLDLPAPAAVLHGNWPDRALAPEPAPGDRVGRYRIVERIGEGGFGIVYVAEQDEPLRRRVALKLIRLGMDTREFIARFEAERQALALMDHPNIARVFDAGATENGRPYLVMECVDGIAITAYCDEHRLSLRERLELFISVCSAIQHAHHKGVIHRDLKPSNILVAHEADAPVPKVIDFGIAKATSGPLTEKTLFTCHLALIGTPGYMSPEQMEINASEVDTRSDLYSLGAILYELLTGAPPFEREVLQRANFDELRRIVREIEPPRPSERVRGFAEVDRTRIAGHRGIDSAKLSVALASDLDWIVMRCLEKHPPQRYVTANALVVDLRRHLDNEPVMARPPSRSYRLRKFVHRHRTPVAAGMAVLLSLFGGLLATGVLLVRERAAAEKSRQVAQFMKDMLGSIGPSVARGRDTTLLREVLDTTIQRLDTELRDQPDIAADLRHTLGVAAQAMGDYDRAAQLWRESIGTRRRLGDNQSAALAASLHELGIVLGRINQAADGENALEEALAIRRKKLGPEHFDVGTTLAALAYNLGSHRSEREREALAREAVRIQRKYPGQNDDAFAQSLMVLGYLLNSRNRYAEARTVLEESVVVGRTLPGVFNPQLANSLQMLVRVMSGRMFVASMRSSEELNLRREMLRLVQQGRGLAHSKLIAALMGFVSGPLPAETLVDDLLLVRGVLTDLRKVLPEDSPDLGVAELAVASAIDLEPGKANEAASLAREAVSRIHRARAKGIPPHRDTSIAMQAFAWENYRDGRMPYALLMAEELNADLTFGSVLSYGVPMARALGYMYFDLGRLDESIAFLEHNARSKQSRQRPLWRMVQRAHLLIDFACLGDAYRQQGRLVESRQVLEEGLARKFQTDEELDPAMNARGAVRGELGYTAMAEGKFAEAEVLFREALKDYDAGAVVNRWNNLRPRGRVVSGLGQALSGQGKILEAEALVVEGYLDLKTNRPTFIGDRSGMLREALDAVVQVYRTTGRPDKAMEWEQQRAEL